MRVRPLLLAAAVALGLAMPALSGDSPAPGAAAASLLGFSPAGAAAHRDLEARFDRHLDASRIGAWIEQLSARPHHLGSPGGRAVAETLVELFRSFGFAAELEEFSVLFPTPRTRRLELLGPDGFTAALTEPPIPEDSTSGQTAERLPAYNAYSIDGDVSGELVYVNYGIPDDYEILAKHGVDVAGRIVIARYGGSWRGIKPKVAAEHGAVGCILYSDPRDDGFFVGDAYPVGGFRPPHGAQRGSVADMPLYPGDPLTPGVGATAGAHRLPRQDARTLTSIPVLPISWADAQPLLAALGGPVAPEAWRGALPLTYHIGSGPARVRLEVQFDWQLVPAYDVIARLEGEVWPDQWIVRGNHHDAWVNGATDPVSGMAAVLAEARAIGELARTGWRPKRTLVYAGWDGEEPGLLGSVEWAERHASELAEKAVVYINSDSNARGILYAGGSHSLERFVDEVARAVTDPQTGLPAARRMRAALELSDSPEARSRAAGPEHLPLEPLGSGSDYTPFLQHLGVCSLDVGFGGEGDYGQYHSTYDSFDHYRRFMDPGFRYGVALAQVGGRLALRLAEADLLPLRFSPLASTVAGYVAEVEALADTMRKDTETENRRIEQGVYRAAWDPEDHWQVPDAEEPVPFLELAPLKNAVAELERAAAPLDAALEQAFGPPSASVDAARAAASTAGHPGASDGTPDRSVAQGSAGDASLPESTGSAAAGDTAARPDPGWATALDAAALTELNHRLYLVERALTRPQGLPGRPWFVHHVYAPGFYTGYGVKTLPGVREAIEQRQWELAEEQIRVLAEVLSGAAAQLDAVLAEIVSAGR